MLLLLSHFSRVRLCATPQMAAYQAPLSLGFSRQEHWSGLPFPSPMHESENWKWRHSVMSDSSRPHGLQPTRLLHPWEPWNFLWQEYWNDLPCPSPGDLPNPGIKPQCPELQTDSLTLSHRVAQFMQANSWMWSPGDEAGPSPVFLSFLICKGPL